MTTKTLTRQANGRSVAPRPNGQQKRSQPAWIEYLVAAYPNASITDLTFAVLKGQLGEYDDDLLMAIVKEHVAKSKWWPTAMELKELLEAHEEIQEKTLGQYYQAALDQSDIMTALSRGDAGAAAAAKNFINSCEASGKTCMAAAMRRRLVAMTGVPDYRLKEGGR